MAIIYTAGPYRSLNGSKDWNGVFENAMRARDYARKLWLKGWAVICPHMNTLFMDSGEIDNIQFIERDLEFIDKCDAIFMLPGWEKSEGAQIEYSRAVELGMPIYMRLEDVPDEG